jgi:hypothetical protein
MKSLEEKKLLLKMSKMLGQPIDQALVESIEREERLAATLFKTSAPILVEEVKQPEVLTEISVPAPKPAETNLVPDKTDQVKAVANFLNTAKTTKSSIPLPYRDAELEGIRKTLAEMMQKISTMSWGGGGTGVVRFIDLDDHKNPRDVNHIELNRIRLPYTPPAGSLAWNIDEDCLDVYQGDGSTLQTGLEEYIRVYNQSGSVIPNGSLVTFGGVDGANPIAIKSTANSTFNPMNTIGVLTNDIQPLSYGRATTFGKVHNLNTTGSDVSETWQLGDILWMHPTQAGKLTRVQPTPPNAVVSVAAVTKVDTVDGEILVRPILIPRMYYASFSDTDPSNHVATAINTPQIAHINTTDISSGFSLGANSNVVCQFSGLYNFQFSLQVTSGTASKADMYIWPRKNKQDVANSSSVFTINTNQGNAVPAWNFVIPMSAGDEFQLMWAVTDTSLVVKGTTSTAFSPAIPSLILTVTQVA